VQRLVLALYDADPLTKKQLRKRGSGSQCLGHVALDWGGGGAGGAGGAGGVPFARALGQWDHPLREGDGGVAGGAAVAAAAAAPHLLAGVGVQGYLRLTVAAEA
jgi:hypothetical protein